VANGTLTITNLDPTPRLFDVETGGTTSSWRVDANATRTVGGLAPGSFTVRAEAADGGTVPVNGRDAYTFTVAPAGPASATRLTPGTTVRRGDEPQGLADDWYVVDARAGDTIEVLHSGDDGGTVTIYDATGHPLSSGPLIVGERTATGATANATGPYYVEILGDGVWLTYAATVEVVAPDPHEPNDGPARATTVAPGGSVTGTVALRERDWFAVKASAGQRVTATLTLTDVQVDMGNDLEVDIIAPDGSSIGTIPATSCPDGPGPTARTTTSGVCDPVRTATQTAVAPETGTYFVRVAGFATPRSLWTYSVQGVSEYALAVDVGGAPSPGVNATAKVTAVSTTPGTPRPTTTPTAAPTTAPTQTPANTPTPTLAATPTPTDTPTSEPTTPAPATPELAGTPTPSPPRTATRAAVANLGPLGTGLVAGLLLLAASRRR